MSLHRLLPGFLSAAEREAALALMSGAAWQAGRQGTGYDRLALDPEALPTALRALHARSLAALGSPEPGCSDLYLLRYPEGASIPGHVDPPLLDGAVHLRLNAVLRQGGEGGALKLDGQLVALAEGDAVLFRPDAVRHEVSRVERGERLLWSVGCNLPPERSPLAPSSRA